MGPSLRSSSPIPRTAAEMMIRQRKSSLMTQIPMSMSIQTETPMPASSVVTLPKQRNQNANTTKRRWWLTHLQSELTKDAKSTKVN